jgi:hypothetical protein
MSPSDHPDDDVPLRQTIETSGRGAAVVVIPVRRFWRVAWPEDPLRIPLASEQGYGRLDDLAGVVPVLYATDSLEPAIFETIDRSAVSAHKRAAAVLAPSTEVEEDSDGESDALRDRMIADRIRQVPPEFYRRCAVEVEFTEGPATLYDLTIVSNRTALEEVPAIAVAMAQAEVKELDRSVIMSPNLALTQAISSELMRGGLSAEQIHGIYSLSRREGYIYAFFCDGRFPLKMQIIQTRRFTREDSEVQRVAKALGLRP